MNTLDLPRVVKIEESILAKNQGTANGNREIFQKHGILAVNLMSSPGSGKTALLEAMLARFQRRLRCAVIVGDCATDNDGRRLSGHGAQVVQITTGGYCHLDAKMVREAMAEIHLNEVDILFIENVGNLVCPASFDLGEELKIGLLSVTEGEDKPLKYPALFSRCDAAVVTKTDMAEAARWNRTTALESLHRAAPNARLFEVSAFNGEGLHTFDRWLEARVIASIELAYR